MLENVETGDSKKTEIKLRPALGLNKKLKKGEYEDTFAGSSRFLAFSFEKPIRVVYKFYYYKI